MKLKFQPNSWSCLPTSLAMLLDIELNELLQKIGHDGSEILFPDLEEPIRRRSFCIEEIQYVTPSYGFVLVPYSGGISYQPTSTHIKEIYLVEQFTAVLEKRDGLLFGTPNGKSLNHVVAWSATEGLIYDPNGTKYPMSGCFNIETFYGGYKC